MDYSYSMLCSLLVIFAFAHASFSPVAVEGKIKGFTLEVIHSHSKLSPFYNQYAATFGKGSHQELHTISMSGRYIVKFYIGTPPREVYAIADTGGDLVWFPCIPCPKCKQQGIPFYEPNRSSSYSHPDHCNSSACESLLGYVECGKKNVCEYLYSYGRIVSSGVLSREKIYIPLGSDSGQLALHPNFAFGCGFQYDAIGLNISHAGIVGLNMGPLSLISQLRVQKFSHCFPPASSNSSGKMVFGDDVIMNGSLTRIVTTSLVTSGNYYFINLEGATVAGSKILIRNPTNFSSDGSRVILSSVYSFTNLAPAFVDSLEAAIIKAIGPPVKLYTSFFNLCYNDVPDIEIVFHFTGADVTLKPVNLFVRSEDGLACLAIFPTQEPGTVNDDDIVGGPIIGDDWMHHLWGNIAQTNFQVTYDLANKLVSFAPTDCAQA